MGLADVAATAAKRATATYSTSGLPSYITSAIASHAAKSSAKKQTAIPTSKATSTAKTTTKVATKATPASSSKTGIYVPSYANPSMTATANAINQSLVDKGVIPEASTTTPGLSTTPIGSVVPAPEVSPTPTAPTPATPTEAAPAETAPSPAEAEASGMTQEEYDKMLSSAIDNLLNPQFIGFQGDRAAELRRLQNYRNQLFGYTTDTGEKKIGSLEQQQNLDKQARRRLAAQRASAGMLQGGSYAGTERGLGTQQEAQQAYALQEMLRPYQEQVASDRLQEFGLGYDPTQRGFSLLDFGNAENIMGGWATGTYAGRQAAANARNQAIQQLLSQGISL